ncbi:lmo0937 family membrane protein [Crenobacter oryzisoli]
MSIAQTLTGDNTMLETIIVVLLVLWALGMLTSFTMGGAVHILLALAVIVLLFRLLQGRRI